MQSNLLSKLHIAVIMDGNGRWALRRGLPRSAGHKAGTEAVREIVEAAPELGIGTLTLYAFSSDNWCRPKAEVNALFALLSHYLRTEMPSFLRNGVRLSVVGRRDRLPSGLADEIRRAEEKTENGGRLHLRVAIDYSGRAEIIRAFKAARYSGMLTDDFLSRLLNGGEAARDVDLLIRTSGEQRLSDFMLWECAYAEFYFTQCLWPDFNGQELARALEVFHHRDRRFGGLGGDETSDVVAGHAVAQQPTALVAAG